MVKDGAAEILFHVEETDFPGTANVPSIYKFAKTEKQKQMLRFSFSSPNSDGPMSRRPARPRSAWPPCARLFAAR